MGEQDPHYEEIELKARLGGIIFQKDDFLIAELSGVHAYRRLVVKGEMADPVVGQEYVFVGVIGPNKKYGGHQLALRGYRTVMPENKAGIHRYLVDVAKWVGPSTAEAITKQYGERALHILKTAPDRVAQDIVGMTQDRAREMAATLVENEALETAMLELNQLLAGVLGPATARKALKAWGSKAPHIIRRNPFDLMQLPGVGWFNSDRVWQKLGYDNDAPERRAAALVAVVRTATTQEGHTALRHREVVNGAGNFLGDIKIGAVAQNPPALLARTPSHYALAEIHQAERAIAEHMAAFATQAPQCFEIDEDGLAPQQVAAVRAFQGSQAFLLVGSPGTGKTYTVGRVVSASRKAGVSVGLCAPTGKAAKQMERAIEGGGQASTIHSMLEATYDKATGAFEFQRDADDPLDYDLLIVDEASMIDVRLMESLLNAVRPTTRLLIVGDPYQLPSVGPGSVLRDLIAGGVPSYELTEIHRHAGRIVRACHQIKVGDLPEPNPPDVRIGEVDNWRHLPASTMEDIRRTVERLVRETLPGRSIDPLWDVQLLSPVNSRGSLSCDAFNALLRPILNQHAHRDLGEAFTIGDKVVRTKNASVEGMLGVPTDDADYYMDIGGIEPVMVDEVRVVNGDIGQIVGIGQQDFYVRFWYPDRLAKINKREHELKLAYCLTGHKMQGSEAPVVLLPLHRELSQIPVWTREWMYTSFSRAKRYLITIGNLSAIRPALTRVQRLHRQTRLANYVKELCDGQQSRDACGSHETLR